jgi:hypothetical protein
VGIGDFGEDSGLTGFDEDDGCDQDDQYRHHEGDDDGLTDESPARCSGEGSLVVGFCSLMD